MTFLPCGCQQKPVRCSADKDIRTKKIVEGFESFDYQNSKDRPVFYILLLIFIVIAGYWMLNKKN